MDRELLEALKIHMLARGVRVSEAANRHLAMSAGKVLTVHEYPTTGGLTLELPDGVLVNAPFDEWFCHESQVTLEATSDGLEVRLGSNALPVVRVLPLPNYIGQPLGSSYHVDDFVMTHADRVRLSPITGCAYDCAFCDLGAVPYVQRPLSTMLAALEMAKRDEALPVRHALISGGSPRRRHYGYFREVCEGIFGTGMEVDIMLSPQVDGTDFVDQMVESGAHGFAINLELHSVEASNRHLGLKYRSTRRHLEEFILRAVELCGRSGRVRSLVIPGLEPVEETLKGVMYLASLGCDPVLSPFRPAAGTKLVAHPPPDPTALATVLRESREIAKHHGVNLGPACVPCQHNTLTFPWDVREVDP